MVRGARGLMLAVMVPGQAQLLMQNGKAELYSVKTPYSSTKAGAARVHVAAPLRVAKRVATDYGRYSQMISKFEQAKIVGKHGKQLDVYLRVPILNGAAKIWAVMRFDPPRKVSPDEYVISGKMLKGNVRQFNLTCRLKEIDSRNTQLNLEMLIVPKLPLPGWAVTTEVAKTARYTVKKLRDAAETKQRKRSKR